ncbi:MAG: PilZ domain-containing protein [Rhodobacteraceae bacterium]|jgi:hypothetical protein|nr:PilZ domain-containing protein [Paracoccaceae bacterium]
MLQRASRLPSRVLVQVRTQGAVFDATIGNLSPGGARLLGVPDRALKVGERIDIQAMGRNLQAEVRWNFDDTCGLMFAQPLSQTDISAILGSWTLH